MATTRPAPAASTIARDRRRWWLSFALFAVLGSLWALSSPIMSAPDEPSHVIKAVATAEGHLRGPLHVVHSTNPRVASGTWTIYRETGTEANLGHKAHCYAFRMNTPAGCLEGVETDSTPVLVQTQMGQYPPLYYALVGWPVHLGLSPDRMVLAMRMVGVLLSAALLASALVAAVGSPLGAMAVGGVVLAVTPMVLFLVGVVNPSGLEIAAALCLWSASLRLLTDDGPVGWRPVTRVAVAAGLLAWARPLSPLYAIGILAAALLLAGRRERLHELWAWRPARAITAVVAVLIASGLVFVLASGALNSFTGFARPGLTHLDAANKSLGKLPQRAEDMIGVFGWGDAHVPTWLSIGWLSAAIGLGLVGVVMGHWRQRLALLGTALAVAVVPVVSEGLRAPEIGFVWQGRYSLPLAVGVPILGGWVVATSGRARQRQIAVSVVLSIAAAVALWWAHAVWMSRNMTGLDHPVLSYLTAHGWHPPIPAWLLGAAMFVAVGLYACWTSWLAAASVPDRPEPALVSSTAGASPAAPAAPGSRPPAEGR